MAVPEGYEANGSPESINKSGTMAVGDCDLDSDEYAISVPSLYWTSDGAAIPLGFLPDAPETADGWAEDVNDDGVVVGRISYGADRKAFIWSDGVMTELVNTLGGTYANAYAINNGGLIVGSAETVDGYPAMSFDMNTGVMTVLGSGTAHDVNDRGEAVGRDIIDFVMVHPMLYKDGQAIDLSAFLPTEFAYAARAGDQQLRLDCRLRRRR